MTKVEADLSSREAEPQRARAARSQKSNPSKECRPRERVDLVLFLLELGPRARDEVDRNAESTHDRPRADGIELRLRRAVRKDGEQVEVTLRPGTVFCTAAEQPDLLGAESFDDPLQDGTKAF